MTRWYCEDQEFTQISKEEKLLRDKIIKVISSYTQEMEGYSYFGSNPGVPEDEYEDIADELLLTFKIEEKLSE